MSEQHWFHKKWGLKPEVPIDEVYERLAALEEKYNALLLDVKRLEEENVETTNELYRVENSLDARIDILAERFWTEQDV
jgi:hypothetical protein